MPRPKHPGEKSLPETWPITHTEVRWDDRQSQKEWDHPDGREVQFQSFPVVPATNVYKQLLSILRSPSFLYPFPLFPSFLFTEHPLSPIPLLSFLLSTYLLDLTFSFCPFYSPSYLSFSLPTSLFSPSHFNLPFKKLKVSPSIHRLFKQTVYRNTIYFL